MSQKSNLDQNDDNILNGIRKAENNARGIKDKAAKEKDELITEAKHMAIKMAGDSEKNAKKKADKIINDAEDKMQVKKEQILSKCKKDFEEFKKKAKKNVPAARDTIFDKFLEKLE